MAHTVQSFVETLRADGVEAGRKAAEEIRREARQQADQLVREAESEAARIVEEAEQQRRKTLERTRVDLEFAARDTVAQLRDSLNQALNRVLSHAVGKTFDDVDFLKDLIREVAGAYAKSDAAKDERIELNVSEPMRRKLADWAIATLHKQPGADKLSFELHGALTTAGFECKLSGGTVEVTPDSVVQVLSRIVTPELRQLIASSQEGRDAEQK